MSLLIVVGIVSILSFLVGIVLTFGYQLKRLMDNDDWDDSNLTNAMRLLSHVVLHPMDFHKMYYLDEDGNPSVQPFWYITKDELSEVVVTRPPPPKLIVR